MAKETYSYGKRDLFKWQNSKVKCNTNQPTSPGQAKTKKGPNIAHEGPILCVVAEKVRVQTPTPQTLNPKP